MTKFRIIHDKNDLYRVQRRILFIFWRQVYELVGVEFYQAIVFHKLSEAEDYIKGRFWKKKQDKIRRRNHRKITVIANY